MAITWNFRLYKKILIGHKIYQFARNSMDICKINCSAIHGRNFSVQEQDKPYASEFAVVLGGGKDTGYHIVEELLQGGVKGVIVGDIIDQVTTNLKRKYGHGKLFFQQCDVSNKDDMEKIFKKAMNSFGKIDIVVNNASIMTDTKWEDNVAVNVKGVVYGTLLGFQHMSTKNYGEGGIIINKSSLFGIQPFYPLPIYTGSKHFILAFTRSLGNHYFYSHSNVKVMAWCPCELQKSLESDPKNGHFGQFIDLDEEAEGQMHSLPFQGDDECGKLIRAMMKAGENGSIWVVEDRKVYKICRPDWQTYKPKVEANGLEELESFGKPDEKHFETTSDPSQINEYTNKPIEYPFQIGEDLNESKLLQFKSNDKTGRFKEQFCETTNGSFDITEEHDQYTVDEPKLKIEDDSNKADLDPCSDVISKPKEDSCKIKENLQQYAMRQTEDLCKTNEVTCEDIDDLFNAQKYLCIPKNVSGKPKETSDKSEDIGITKQGILEFKNHKIEHCKNETVLNQTNDDSLTPKGDHCKIKEDLCIYKGQRRKYEDHLCKLIENADTWKEERLNKHCESGKFEEESCKSKGDSDQSDCNSKGDSCDHRYYNNGFLCLSKEDNFKSKQEQIKTAEDSCEVVNNICSSRNDFCKPELNLKKTIEVSDEQLNGFEMESRSHVDPSNVKDDSCKATGGPKEVSNKPEYWSKDSIERNVVLSKTNEGQCKSESAHCRYQEGPSNRNEEVSTFRTIIGNRKNNNRKFRSEKRRNSKKAFRRKNKRLT